MLQLKVNVKCTVLKFTKVIYHSKIFQKVKYIFLFFLKYWVCILEERKIHKILPPKDG